MIYLFVAVVATEVRGQEIFPFFNWSLFSAASNPKTDNVLVIRSVDGVKLARPTLFYDMGRRFSAAKRGDSRVAKATDQLRYAVTYHDPAREKQLRATIETTFMGEADQVEYDLAVMAYDPIERLNSGAILARQTIRSYRKGER